MVSVQLLKMMQCFSTVHEVITTKQLICSVTFHFVIWRSNLCLQWPDHIYFNRRKAESGCYNLSTKFSKSDSESRFKRTAERDFFNAFLRSLYAAGLVM